MSAQIPFLLFITAYLRPSKASGRENVLRVGNEQNGDEKKHGQKEPNDATISQRKTGVHLILVDSFFRKDSTLRKEGLRKEC